MICLGLSSAGAFPEKGLLPRLGNVENVKIMAISDVCSKEKLDRIANTFRIDHTYTDYNSMLKDDRLDAVYICSPNVFHKEMVIAAANSQKHILCEKPLGLNVDECRQMVQTCQENSVKLAVNFCYLSTASQLKVKEIVDSGILGKISHIHISFSLCNFNKNVAGWRGNPKLSGGGPLMDLCPHLISLACFLLDDKVKSVMAYVTPRKTDSDVENDTVSILEFQKGCKVSIDSSFNRCRENNYTIIGEKGCVCVEGTMGWTPGGKIFLQTLTDVFCRQEIAYNKNIGIENHFREFSKYIEFGSNFFATGQIGLHVQSVIDAIYVSNEQGKRIEIERRF